MDGVLQVHFSTEYTVFLSHNFRKSLTMSFIQPVVGPDGKKKEFESNVLLASIENMQYAVTVDVLHTVRIVLICYI